MHAEMARLRLLRHTKGAGGRPPGQSLRGRRLSDRIIEWIANQAHARRGTLSDVAKLRLEVAQELALRGLWAQALTLADRALARGSAASEQDLETFAKAWAARDGERDGVRS